MLLLFEFGLQNPLYMLSGKPYTILSKLIHSYKTITFKVTSHCSCVRKAVNSTIFASELSQSRSTVCRVEVK